MKKMRTILITCLFLLTCVLAQAEVSTGEVIDSHGLIRGLVTDTETPRPNTLADATVTVESSNLPEGTMTVKTDETGNYQIRNLPPGEYAISAKKQGYDNSMEYVTVVANGETFHDIRLYRTDMPIGTLPQWTRIWGVAAVCLAVVIVYMISRRFRNKGQNK